MNAELSSSTSEFKDLIPMSTDEYAMASGMSVDVQPLNPWFIYRYDAWRRLYSSGYEEMADPVITSIINAEKFFVFDHSSAVFASNGPKRTKFQAYSVRISTLRHTAAQDGYFLNPASEFDFWNFIELDTRLRKGNLVLMDNGNLRAVWKGDQKTHFGLQFLGGGMVQYVIFKQREATQSVSRVAGRDTFEGVKKQIRAFELHSLLYE